MDTLTSMQVFRLVAELKSFAAAGRRMEMSAAMVSKHVMHLETRLNTRLLNRTSRHVSLTESGALYFEQSRQMLDGLEEVEAAITKATVVARGTLRISAPVWLANPAFVGVLVDYRAKYPDVNVEMDLSGRIVNLVEEGFDLALRASSSPGDNLIARPVATVPFYLVGSPAYLAKAGTPKSLADLSSHAMLWYSLAPTSMEWPAPESTEPEMLNITPVLQSTNESLLHLAALQGMGVALLPKWLIEADLQAGSLVHVLSKQPIHKATLYGVYPSRKYLSSKVRTFLDFLLEDPRLQ
ncbi:MAG TPA: LysR family transcriptional regulator [Noviherbaspirillum sp.]|uniref:LysR family transcriptional regulator n=1 Tax=Noviherbaspirillum sp. TaxID=1926288 RepID=UPI002F93D3BF